MDNQFKLINRIFAFSMLVIGLIVYGTTVAPSLSFWDCGEFISSAFVFGSPHPPGAPLFMIVGRVAAMLAGNSAETVALYVNWISVLSSAFTLFFMYMSVMLLFADWKGKAQDMSDFLVRAISSSIATLCFAFSHSFWFNAVEAEMYGPHMLFLSAILYLMLRWLSKSDEEGNERYFLLIAYLMGLSIGVHLLTVLIVPALAILYYSKKAKNKSYINLALSFIVGCIILLFIYPGIVKMYPNLVLAFGSIGWGVVILFLLIGGSAYFISQNKKSWLSIALQATMLIVLGYTTYGSTYVRSGLNPKLDMYNPENLTQMMGLINREQYGEMYLFPRRWSVKGARTSHKWVGDGTPLTHNFGQGNIRAISSFKEFNAADNKITHLWAQIQYTWNYQISHLLWRYIGWNFVGLPDREVQDANSDFSKLWALPLLLAVFGAFYMHKNDTDKFWAMMTIWFMFGLAIIFYTNPNEPQPRERDYTFVACFYAMAIWMAYGAIGIVESLRKMIESKTVSYAVLGVLFLALPVNMLAKNYHSHDRSSNYVAWDMAYNILMSCEPNAVLFNNGDNDTYPIWFLQIVEGIRPDVTVVNLSLINTPWYINQHKSGQLGRPAPISFSDKYIDKIQFRRWDKEQIVQIPVPDSINLASNNEFRAGKNLPLLNGIDSAKRNISFKLGPQMTFPTAQGTAGILRIQDQMVLHMIYTNKWKRPINFAATIASSNLLGGLKEYMKLDGLVYKLTPVKGWSSDLAYLEDLLLNKYQYRGLGKNGSYIDQMTISLMQNYRNGFLQLAEKYGRQGNSEKQAEIVNKMNELIDPETVPITNSRLKLQIEIMNKFADLSKVTAESIAGEYTVKEIEQIWQIAHFSMKNFELRNIAMEAHASVLPAKSDSKEQILRYLIDLNKSDKVEVAKYLDQYEKEYPSKQNIIDALKNRYL